MFSTSFKILLPYLFQRHCRSLQTIQDYLLSRCGMWHEFITRSSDYRRGLNWELDLLDNFTARDCTSQITATHRPVSSVTLLDNGFQRLASSASGLTSLQGGDHLTPTSYSDPWLQLAPSSAASSWAGLNSNCQPAASAVNSRLPFELN
jgi:hypothetical protein